MGMANIFVQSFHTLSIFIYIYIASKLPLPYLTKSVYVLVENVPAPVAKRIICLYERKKSDPGHALCKLLALKLVLRSNRRKKRAFRTTKRTNKKKDWDRYRKLQKDNKKTVKDPYNNYISNLVSEDASNNKKLHSFIKSNQECPL